MKYYRPWSSLDDERLRILVQYYHGPNTSGSRCSIDKSFISHRDRRRRAITQILFDLLMTLRNDGEDVVADAIWQSTGNPSWPKMEEILEIVSSVAQFPSGLKAKSHVFA